MDINSNEILAGYAPAPLENWLRYNYFNNEIDISGSGVEEYSLREIREITQFPLSDLDKILMKDSETLGGAQIRSIIADTFGNGIPDMVMITNGSNEALQLAIRSTLTPGDEIITQHPCYHCHDKIALSIGCTVKKWKFTSTEDFDLEIDGLAKLITNKTRAVVLNFPHNPTGVSINQHFLSEIITLLKERSIYLIWDAAFQELVYDQPALPNPILTYDKTIITGTFSKAFGAPGLRFGWIIAPSGIIANCVRQKDYGNLFVSPITEFIAVKMLQNIAKFSTPRLSQAAYNRTLLNGWIVARSSVISWRQPDGGVCGLVKLPNNIDDHHFCSELLRQQRVLLIPGSCFDMERFVRIGFGCNTEMLVEGLRRMDLFLENTI